VQKSKRKKRIYALRFVFSLEKNDRAKSSRVRWLYKLVSNHIIFFLYLIVRWFLLREHHAYSKISHLFLMIYLINERYLLIIFLNYQRKSRLSQMKIKFSLLIFLFDNKNYSISCVNFISHRYEEHPGDLSYMQWSIMDWITNFFFSFLLIRFYAYSYGKYGRA